MTYIFLNTAGYLFNISVLSFDVYEFLILMKPNISIFYFIACMFGAYSESHCQI